MQLEENYEITDVDGDTIDVEPYKADSQEARVLIGVKDNSISGEFAMVSLSTEQVLELSRVLLSAGLAAELHNVERRTGLKVEVV